MTWPRTHESRGLRRCAVQLLVDDALAGDHPRLETRSLGPSRAAARVGALSSPAAGALFVVFVARVSPEPADPRVGLRGHPARRLRVQARPCLGLHEGGAIQPRCRPHGGSGADVPHRRPVRDAWLSPSRLGSLLPSPRRDRFCGFPRRHCPAALDYDTRLHERTPPLMAAGVFTVLSAVPAPLVSDPPAGAAVLLPAVRGFGWLLLVIWRRSRRRASPDSSGVLLCVSLLGLATTFSRPGKTTAKLSWETEVRRCATSIEPTLPRSRSTSTGPRSTSTGPTTCSGRRSRSTRRSVDG